VENLIPLQHRANKSSYEILFESLNMSKQAKTPYIKYLRSYFYDAYYYLKPAYRIQSEKLAPRVRKAKLIGYSDLYGSIYLL